MRARCAARGRGSPSSRSEFEIQTTASEIQISGGERMGSERGCRALRGDEGEAMC